MIPDDIEPMCVYRPLINVRANSRYTTAKKPKKERVKKQKKAK